MGTDDLEESRPGAEAAAAAAATAAAVAGLTPGSGREPIKQTIRIMRQST
jgi:hypothetical protein